MLRVRIRSLLTFVLILALTGIAPASASNSTITYNDNRNQYQTGVTSGSLPAQTTVAQGMVTVAANSGNLARQGFTFAGWNTLANGTGQTYAAGTGTFNLTADITLYAKWEIPAAARLIGNGGTIIKFKNTANLASGSTCTGSNVRGITSDGTYMYFRPSAAANKICKMDMNGEFVALSPDISLPGTGDSIAITYSSGCIFVRVTGLDDNSEIKCVSTSDWSITSIAYPVGKGLYKGGIWLYGNMITFPDGRIGAVSAPNFGSNQTGCPSGMVCKILRLYNVSGTGAGVSLTFSTDMYLADESDQSSWPGDDHGIATDGTYLYQVRHENGYKVWALRENAPSYIVFNGDKSGETTCSANSSTGSGTLCKITYPINGASGSVAALSALGNSTYIGRNHTTGQYFLGDYNGTYFYKSDSATPPAGPGTLDQTAPSFNNSTSFSLAEGSATTTIAATISVSESSTLTMVVGGDSSLLNLTVVDSVTAQIKLNSVSNFESPIDGGANNTYICTIRATDTLGNTDTQTITITITNINEAPTIGAFSGALSGSYSANEGSTGLFNLDANDVDSGTTLTYSLSGTDSSFFAINSIGFLSFATARNFESPQDSDSNNSYQVIAQVSDGALTDSQTITVSVTDFNEAPVIVNFSSNPSHAISIAEGNSNVVTFTATDVDTGTTLTWSISGADANDFTINTSTGVLEFLSAPDFEAPTDSGGNNGYLVIIAISDGALSDTQTLTITLTNVNEAGTVSAPTISGTAYKGITITLTVAINTPGKVRFFVGGKRIANCLARPSSGNYPNITATCAWKPANLGPQIVTASLAPTDSSFAPASSSKSSIWVFRRTTTR